jgi:hypothetical protein
MDASLKTKDRSAIWSSNPTLGIYPKECDSGYNSGTIHNRQVMETAKMPYYQQMD